MEDAKLAYIAGIIDGEGSIMLVKACHASFMKQQNRKYPNYYPSVRVGMIEHEALDFIVDTLKIGKVVKEKSYQNKRPMYRYRLTNKPDVRKFLEIMTPYLMIKKQQAILLMQYIDTFISCSAKNPVTEEIENNRHEYWTKMREMNGVASPATTEPWGKRGRSKSVRLEATV
jgi:hypothetical protein